MRLPIVEPALEVQIVLESLAPRFSPTVAARAVAADWGQVQQLAHSHRVLPLVAKQLRTQLPEILPSPVASQLKSASRRNGQKNLHMAKVLCRVIETLAEHGIQAIPFRGPALAAQAYGDLNARQFGDLDILVDREQIPRLIQFLGPLGFRPDLSSLQMDAYLRFAYEYTLIEPELEIPCEFHWEWLPIRFPRTLQSHLQVELTQVDVVGRSIPTPTPEWQLPLLAAHGAKHLWSALVWLADIAHLVQAPDLDWDRTFVLAEKLRTRHALASVLSLAVTLLGVELPSEVRLENPSSDLVRVAARLTAGASREAGWWETRRFHLQTLDDSRDRLRYLIHHLFSPTVTDVKTLHLPFWWLYYLWRPTRMFGDLIGIRHGSGVARKRGARS